MQKAGRRRWQTLVLVGLALILGAGLLIQGVGLLMAWLTPNAATSQDGKSSLTGTCTMTQQGPVFKQVLVVDGGATECGDLTLVESTLDVRGRVRGTILAYGSNINIAGTVNGDINLYGGVATLRSGSQVHGNINLFGGSEKAEPGAQLDGVMNNRVQPISLWLPGVNTGFAFPLWPLLVWVILGQVLVSLLPEHVMFVRTTVTSKARRSLFLGLLSLLLAPLVLLVLIALIIPIPLAVLIAIGLIAAWALGTIAIGWQIGDFVMRVIAPRHNTRLLQVSVGLALLVLAGSLPYIGWIVSIGAGLLGLGAVFLSRFGTRLYSQPRQPLTF